MTNNVLHSCNKQKGVSIINIISLGWLAGIIYGTYYMLDNKYHYEQFGKHQCNITNITYPTQPYSADHQQNWIKCNCGGSDSDIGVMPCIKLYDNKVSNKMITNYYTDNPSTNYKDDKIHKYSGCTWISIKSSTCDKTFTEIENYLSDMYNYTIYTNINCYYKKNANPDIYFDIGHYKTYALILMGITGIGILALVIIWVTYTSMCNDRFYMYPYGIKFNGYNDINNQNKRNFYVLDFYMWFLLIRKGLIIIVMPIFNCCKEIFKCCITIDNNFTRAAKNCFKKNKDTKMKYKNINNGDIEYIYDYGSIPYDSTKTDKVEIVEV